MALQRRGRKQKRGSYMQVTETQAAQSAAKSMRDLKELLTVKEVAEYAHLSRGTVYKLVASGELKSVRVRNAIRINRDNACEYFGI